MTKKWSPRFSQAADRRMADYNDSLRFDRRLAVQDLTVSLAHAEMLKRQRIISAADFAKLKKGLSQILAEVRAGKSKWNPADEDIHFAVERRLVTLVGTVGKKLHTARSRNDQAVTGLRLWLRDEIDAIRLGLADVRQALVDQASRHTDTIMPGMTHLQPAQPVTFAHHLMAYVHMFERDDERLSDCRRRTNVLPLGACALAGTSFPVDQSWVARKLGFDAVCSNSMDAVSDRDFAVEFCAACSLVMVHLSRLAEELVMWSSPAFGFVRIDDSFCTGSSIMPQKRNPDVPELARGKVGRVAGSLMSLLMLMKGQPLAYNKDNQEDKEPLFDCADTLRGTVGIFAAMIPSIAVDEGAMRSAADQGYSTATELADYFVRKGVPFRDAHAAVSAVVQHAEKRGISLEEISTDELRRLCKAPVSDDICDVLSPEKAILRRDHAGGPAPRQVRAQIRKSLRKIDALRKSVG